MWSVITPLLGVLIGGGLTLATSVWVEDKRSAAQARLRRSERSEAAAQDIANSLVQLHNPNRNRLLSNTLPAERVAAMGQDLTQKIKLDILRLTDGDARERFRK